ncbi:hydrolase family protein [Mycobacteroides abscessus MAB_091912_2446]|uniref:Hydrolase family protein n=1 Tax=Mycobacteroides abscessus MAB_091912_2446 TaxID=1335414 RepID=A0A829M970_9MYCO|nr:hydrolase family protein [Mycobacteroides abscessus MAB_091912_2446]
MADLPFGFAAGDDPDRERGDAGRGSSGSGSSGADPFGFGSGGFNPADLGQIFTQLGQMFSGAAAGAASGQPAGPVNYDIARQLASSSIGFVAPITASTTSAITDAVHLADTWLDGATALPAGATRTAAWTATDWVDNTLENWKRLVDPVAEQISGMWAANLPEEAQSMAGPLLGMMTQMGGMAFGSQLGQALGQLSREVLTSTDIGLPLGPKGTAALMPAAIETFSEGLEQSKGEIMTFLAAREAAHHRLFSGVGWLTIRLMDTVEQYAKGISIDMSAIEEAARGFNPAAMGDPSEMEQILSQGIFEPKTTPQQEQALERLETLLALVEGWVQTVVTDALGERIPATAALSETLRRRRATGGPAEQTFATLVGLELRPRKLREAADLWRKLTDAVGVDKRDAVWAHPDLMPDASDLDNPAAFIDRIIGGDTDAVDDPIAQIQKLDPGTPRQRTEKLRARAFIAGQRLNRAVDKRHSAARQARWACHSGSCPASRRSPSTRLVPCYPAPTTASRSVGRPVTRW